MKEKELTILNDDYNDNNFNEKIDIWYLGLLCYEMLFGNKIFGEGNNNGHIDSDLFVIIPQSISLDAQTFLLSMLQKDTNKRLSAKELLKHEFIKKNPVLNINVDNPRPNILEKSITPKKHEEKTFNLNITNTPMTRVKYKTLVPEDRLRLSAKFSRANHKKFQTMVNDSDIININNNKNNSSNNNIKTEPMIGPQLKKGENKLIIPQCKPRVQGEVLGCTSPILNKKNENNYVIFICDGRFHMESVMIQNPLFKYYQYGKPEASTETTLRDRPLFERLRTRVHIGGHTGNSE